MSLFLGSLARVGGVLAAIWIAGALASSGVGPPDRAFRAERAGWSWALGAGLAAGMVPLAFMVCLRGVLRLGGLRDRLGCER